MNKDPYCTIKMRCVTEKSSTLENLKNADGNKSVKACKAPKYVFFVDRKANKQQIAGAIEDIYKEKNVKVVAVNTINVKPKPKGRMKKHFGKTSRKKKAIVTFEPGDSLDDV